MNTATSSAVPLADGVYEEDDANYEQLMDELLLEMFVEPQDEDQYPEDCASNHSTSLHIRVPLHGSRLRSFDDNLYPSSDNNSDAGIRNGKSAAAIPGSPTESSSDDHDDASSTACGAASSMESTLLAKKRRQLEMRRKRNREAMQRVRERKRLEDSQLHKLLTGLEMKLQGLQTTQAQQQGGAAGGGRRAMLVQNSLRVDARMQHDFQVEMAELHTQQQKIQSENARLAQEIYKHEQAFHALRDLIAELRAADRVTPQLDVSDAFLWVSRIVALLPQLYSSEIYEFIKRSIHEVMRQVDATNKLSEGAHKILGWRYKHAVKGEWVEFVFSKDFIHGDVDAISEKTWMVQSHSHQVNATMPQNHFMKVLRAVNDNTLICARNLYFPGDDANYCTIYLLMRVKTSNGWLLAQRSLLPDDCALMQRQLGENLSYVNVCYGMILSPLASDASDGTEVGSSAGCNTTFGGKVGNGTEHYANIVGQDTFFSMLRWENACVGPLYRLL